MACLERHAIPVSEEDLAVAFARAGVLEGHAREAEDPGEVSAERACGHRAVADDFVDAARIEPRRAGPGVELPPLRHRHFEPHAIGELELQRIAMGNSAGGGTASRGVARLSRLQIAAVDGLHADVLFQIVGHGAESCARAFQNSPRIGRRLATAQDCGRQQDRESKAPPLNSIATARQPLPYSRGPDGLVDTTGLRIRAASVRERSFA